MLLKPSLHQRVVLGSDLISSHEHITEFIRCSFKAIDSSHSSASICGLRALRRAICFALFSKSDVLVYLNPSQFSLFSFITSSMSRCRSRWYSLCVTSVCAHRYHSLSILTISTVLRRCRASMSFEP